MTRLGVIPSDPIEAYLDAGYNRDWLESYYDPMRARKLTFKWKQNLIDFRDDSL